MNEERAKAMAAELQEWKDRYADSNARPGAFASDVERFCARHSLTIRLKKGEA